MGKLVLPTIEPVVWAEMIDRPPAMADPLLANVFDKKDWKQWDMARTLFWTSLSTVARKRAPLLTQYLGNLGQAAVDRIVTPFWGTPETCQHDLESDAWVLRNM